MNNDFFEQKAVQASAFHGSVKADYFSWSCAREKLFLSCERACFLRYYLAQGGWDPYAHSMIRSAYREKYVMPTEIWLARTFQNAVQNGFREAMTRKPAARKRAFSSVCLKHLSKAVFDLQFSIENKEYMSDPRKPVLLEYLHSRTPDQTFLELKQRAVKSFSTAYAGFVKSFLFAELLNLDITDFRLDETFFSFQFEQYPIWFAPGLVYFRNGVFNMLLFHNSEEGDAGEEVRILAGLFAMYVRSKWKKQEYATQLFSFSSFRAELMDIRPLERVRTRIRQNAGAMFSKIKPDGTVCCEDFACTEDTEICRTCQFAGTCGMLNEWHRKKKDTVPIPLPDPLDI